MQLTLDPERMKAIKLWILVPAAGDLIHATFANCLVRLLVVLRQHSIHADLIFLPGDSLVTRARNNLAHMFLAQSSDSESHFSLWLDCDILFDPISVLQLIALDLDFTAAPYSKKGLHQDRIAEAARLNLPNDRMMAASGTPNVNWLTNPVRLDEPMPVLEAGTGFWLVKRKVFEQLRDSGSAPLYRRSHEEHAHYGPEGYDFFRVGVWPETGEYLSEDWWFCREWRRLGGTLHCCFWIKTNHIGPYLFPMDMPAIADLLAATGGTINGPTREEPHATTQVRSGTSGTTAKERRTEPSNGHRSDILRAVAAASYAPDQAAGASDSGTLGG